MSFGSILGGIGGLISAGVSGYNTYQQMKTQEYEKEVQKETWEREDNAVQRRVTDLKAAGLNPVLAAGQGASSSSPIHLTTPQVDNNIGQDAQAMLGLMTMKKDMERTDAQKFLLKQQGASAAWDANVKMAMDKYASDSFPGVSGTEMAARMQWEKLSAETSKAKSDAAYSAASANEARYNLDLAQKYGIRSGSSETMDLINSGEYLNQMLNKESGSKTGPALSLLSRLLESGVKNLMPLAKKRIPTNVNRR